VLLVEGEGGLAVESVEDVALGAGDDALGSELVPSALGAVSDGDVVSVEPDGDDDAAPGLVAEADPGALEAGAVAGQASGDDDGLGEDGGEAGDELAAVDGEALAEDEDAAEVGPLELAREGLAGGEGLGRGGDLDQRAHDRGLVEASDGDGEGLVAHRGADDLAGAGAADERGAGVGAAELGEG